MNLRQEESYRACSNCRIANRGTKQEERLQGRGKFVKEENKQGAVKHFIICLLSIIISSIASGLAAKTALTPDQLDALWNGAGVAYYAGDFASTAALYDSIERSGMVSAKLYYNKAGALFKMGKIGESILYYNKAQRLAPGDDDIRHNLAIANTYTRNRIEPVPEFFLKRWMRGLSYIMSGNAWAGLSMVFFALALAGALLYLLPLARRTRETGFYGSVASIVLLAFAFSFARSYWREATHATGGIVTSGSAAVKSSPDNAGKDLFLLYEGDKVEVRDELGEWSEITVANGNRGWIRSAVVSMID